MKNIAGFALLVALAACGGSTMTSEPDPVEPERPVPCTFPNETCAERVEIATARYLPVYSTHLLSEGHAGVTRGLIVIHGNTRDADTYFETGVLAATSSRFPAMEEIVVAGHSAGGQVVHRYAATTEHTATDSGVAFRYVVTNPSTYLYLGPRREDAEGGFTVPDTGCDDYDEWHYGLQDRNSYADRLEADSIRRPAGPSRCPDPPRGRRHDLRFARPELRREPAGPAPLPPRPHPGPLHGRAVRRARPPGDDRAGRGALQPVDVAVGGGGGGALRQLTAGWGPVGGRFQRWMRD